MNKQLSHHLSILWGFREFASLCLFITLFLCPCLASDTTPLQNHRTTMLGGWYEWDPYQYLATPGDPKSITGLDYELEKAIMEKAGYKIDIPPVSWKQHNEDLEEGKRDFGMGAFYSERRAKYNYFSHSYRFEENSVFVLKDDSQQHNYSTIPEFIKAIKENNLIIGVVDGYRYANDAFNEFVADPENAKYIRKSVTDNDNMRLLLAKNINGFIADKIVGATIIWREKKGRLINEIHLSDSKAPVYMLLSKKSVTIKEYDHINATIKDFVGSDEYKKIVTWYLYPVLLLETIDAPWFYFIELLGIASFALSGVIIAYRVNASLLGTFLLALIPSFGGGILRDVIFGRYPIGFILSTSYIIIVLTVSILGFFSVKAFNYYKSKARPETLQKISMPFQKQKGIIDGLLITTDAIGLAAFTVTGVLICMLAKVSPLWLWGPFFAFLTGAGGGFIRDIIVRDLHVTKQPIEAINGSLYGENAVIWGGFLSFYLYWTASDADPKQIKMVVIITIIACFISRLNVAYGYKIPNIYFNNGGTKKEGSS